MALSYPLTPPAALKTCKVTIYRDTKTGITESEFTYQAQVQVGQGQRWRMDAEMPPMSRADAEEVVSFLIGLNGREGTFLLGDNANKTARGVGTGTPKVEGASQTGYDLNTDGWTAQTAGILKAGDWIQLGTAATSRLYKVMVDANSNTAGEATLTLWPRLRSSPADNATIVVSSPVGLWRLADASFGYSIDLAKFYGVNLSAVEAL